MKLDHCHRASCTQIIEALRAENARLILLEGQHEFNHSRYLNLCRDLAACQRERDEAQQGHFAQIQLESQLAAMTKERDDASRTSEYWKSLALALPNDSSALEARLAQEREKCREAVRDGSSEGDYYADRIEVTK